MRFAFDMVDTPPVGVNPPPHLMGMRKGLRLPFLRSLFRWGPVRELDLYPPAKAQGWFLSTSPAARVVQALALTFASTLQPHF